MFRAILAVAGTMTIAVGLGVSGTAAVAKNNPDQHFNFECSNCQQNTTIDKGITNIYVTCYGKPAKKFACSSPEVGIICGEYVNSVGSFCQCVSDTPKAHTVHVKMKKDCHQ